VYLRNCWYIAASPDEVGEEPLGRIFLGEAVVLFRSADGTTSALEDRCCHRSLPLSMGQVKGDNLQCGYHGLEFDASGTCVAVPGQSLVPPGASVRRYPLVERHNWLWIWMGEADAADPAMIPYIFWRDDPAWVAWGAHWQVRCAYNLLIDIQLDNTHAPYVHPDTLGSGAITDTPPAVERTPTSVTAARWMMDVVPSPTFARALGTEENVDRWLLWEFLPPSLCAFDIGCAHAGTGAETGDRSQGITLHTAHFMTPETDTSCHYFWSVGRNYNIANSQVTDAMNAEFSRIFREDVDIVEAQQRSLDRAPGWQPIDVTADAPVLQARNVLNNMIAEEARS
jgi:phenylpropionate dioxygenase-like ring-hydroxylating dioxygenase large terminal subunit